MDGTSKEIEEQSTKDVGVSENYISHSNKLADFKLASPKLKVKQSSVTSDFTPKTHPQLWVLLLNLLKLILVMLKMIYNLLVRFR